MSLHTDAKEEHMTIIEHIREDWLYRLPYRLDHMKFKGANRPAYTLLCLMYYSVKALLLLFFALAFRFFKFFLYDLWRGIFTGAWNEEPIEDDDYEEDEWEDYEEDSTEWADASEELPFCQLFNIGPDMCLLVDHIEMCPDETAFIRVVDDEGYTPLYKRKVKREKDGRRFIVFNGTKHYLNDDKTQPVVTRK